MVLGQVSRVWSWTLVFPLDEYVVTGITHFSWLHKWVPAAARLLAEGNHGRLCNYFPEGTGKLGEASRRLQKTRAEPQKALTKSRRAAGGHSKPPEGTRKFWEELQKAQESSTRGAPPGSRKLPASSRRLWGSFRRLQENSGRAPEKAPESSRRAEL